MGIWGLFREDRRERVLPIGLSCGGFCRSAYLAGGLKVCAVSLRGLESDWD
jgi:hypothetical protein